MDVRTGRAPDVHELDAPSVEPVGGRVLRMAILSVCYAGFLLWEAGAERGSRVGLGLLAGGVGVAFGVQVSGAVRRWHRARVSA